MAKVLTTIYRIEGVLDGSLISAIQRASSAMKGLKAASTGKIDIGRFGELQSKLAELQKVQAAMLRLKQLQGEMGKSWAAAREKTSSYGKLQGEVNLSRAALEQLKRQMSELKTQRDTSTGSARREASEQLRVLKEQYALRQSQLREMEQRLKSSKRETTAAQGNYASQAAELRQLSSALNAAGISARNFAGAEQSLKSAIDTTTAALKAQERLSSALKAHNDAGENLNTAWGNVSNTMSTAASIMQPFKAAVDNAENFEHEMSRVKALTQSDNIRKGFYAQTASEMKELEAQARELGATTQFTMTQAAQAQGFLGMAGWSKDQIIKAMPGMLDLAAASGMDLARTADIVSDNLTALGMDATQVGHMTDVYAYALTRSNLNMEALGESMKYAAPAMHAYGGDIHDAAAAMMIMGNAGIKGSMAGTALRMGLLRLAGPPKKATKEMEALGISLSDATRMAYESQAQLEALGIHVDDGMQPTEKMKYVLEELGQKMQGLSKDEKLAAVGAIFGVNAASGWLAVLEQGPEQFANFRDALRKSDGTAKQIAKTMNDDTRGAWLYLESAIDAVSNNIGSAFLPALKSTYEGLNPVVTSMAQWIGEHPGVVQGFGAIAAAAAGGMVALGGFRVAMAGISFVTTTVEMMQATAAFADGNDGGRGRRVCKTECVVDDLSNARAGDGDQNDRICIAGDGAIGDGIFACAVERDDGRLDGCVYETRSGDSDGAGARINQHVSNDRVGNAECGGVGGIVYLQSVGRGVGSDSGDSGGGVFDLQQLGSTRAVLRRDNESAEFGDRRGICPDRAGNRAIGHGMDGNDVGV